MSASEQVERKDSHGCLGKAFIRSDRSCIEDPCHSSRGIANGECAQIISILQAVQAVILIDPLLLNIATRVFDSYSVGHIHNKRARVDPCETSVGVSLNNALQDGWSANLMALYVNILTKLSRIPVSRPWV